VWAAVNDTFVPWKWHEEAKGIHVVGKGIRRKFSTEGTRIEKSGICNKHDQVCIALQHLHALNWDTMA